VAGNAENIIVGAADVSVGGADVGFTKGGVSVRYEPEFLSIKADQAVGTVRKARTDESMFVKTMLLEVTLERMRQAFMQPSSHLTGGGKTLTLGYNNACWVDEVTIILVGVSPGCGTRTFTFTKCVAMGTREYNMQRDEETSFEVEWEIVKDANGIFGTIVDSP
jgi:hypothetical protein